ncbi:unnamed protein product [Oikopleura dioica]|uniref:Uncharacterized protein n=1 Tax=Oikopleura dioica TaxID=34765 RepID=E4XKS0_OIKDI|nr:unnamed protein product [Oikopleura dioica]
MIRAARLIPGATAPRRSIHSLLAHRIIKQTPQPVKMKISLLCKRSCIFGYSISTSSPNRNWRKALLAAHRYDGLLQP